MTRTFGGLAGRLAAPAVVVVAVGVLVTVSNPPAGTDLAGLFGLTLYGAGVGGLVVAGYIGFAVDGPDVSPDRRVAKADGGSTAAPTSPDIDVGSTASFRPTDADPPAFTEFSPASPLNPRATSDSTLMVIPEVSPPESAEDEFIWIDDEDLVPP